MDLLADPQALAARICEVGYAKAELNDNLLARVFDIYGLADDFFHAGLEAKQACRSAAHVEGYLPIGSEYSIDQDRRDLHEGFLVWSRNRGLRHTSLEQSRLRSAMHSLFAAYTQGSADIIAALRARIAPDAPPLELSDHSYMQVNFYEPAKHDRDTLQDRHEDGHLLNFVKATSPGLEIEVDGRFEPVRLARNEVLVMPGSVLTALTGGLIPPLYHQVRNLGAPASRLSLMFFINPPVRPIAPWIVNDTNRDTNILDLLLKNSAMFGLPALDELA